VSQGASTNAKGNKMRIDKLLKPADFVTMANLMCGIFSIINSIKGNYFYAIGFMILAVVFDGLDGKVAKLCKKGCTEFGKQVDSLSDLISFGVTPAIFGYCIGLKGIGYIVLLALFVVCGMLRLSRYNVTDTKGFEGVPITVNGVLFPVLYVAFYYLAFPIWVFAIFYVLMGGLMISSLKIKRI